MSKIPYFDLNFNIPDNILTIYDVFSEKDRAKVMAIGLNAKNKQEYLAQKRSKQKPIDSIYFDLSRFYNAIKDDKKSDFWLKKVSPNYFIKV